MAAKKCWVSILSVSFKIGVCLISISATLLLPCLPLMIEWLRDGHMKSDTISITATVLASALIFTTEHPLLFFAYLVLFIANFLLSTVGGPSAAAWLEHYAGTLLIAVCFLHACERFFWHCVLDRPFPDRVRFTKASGE